MRQTITCPTCKASLGATEEAVPGKRVKCPKCAMTFAVAETTIHVEATTQSLTPQDAPANASPAGLDAPSMTIDSHVPSLGRASLDTSSIIQTYLAWILIAVFLTGAGLGGVVGFVARPNNERAGSPSSKTADVPVQESLDSSAGNEEPFQGNERTVTDLAAPTIEKERRWTDRSGNWSMRAALVAVHQGAGGELDAVELRLGDGAVRRIPIAQLSVENIKDLYAAGRLKVHPPKSLLAAKLSQPCSCNAQDISLRETLNELSITHDVPILVDPNISKNINSTLQLRGELREVLDALLRPHELSITKIADRVLYVRHIESIEQDLPCAVFRLRNRSLDITEVAYVIKDCSGHGTWETSREHGSGAGILKIGASRLLLVRNRDDVLDEIELSFSSTLQRVHPSESDENEYFSASPLGEISAKVVPRGFSDHPAQDVLDFLRIDWGLQVVVDPDVFDLSRQVVSQPATLPTGLPNVTVPGGLPLPEFLDLFCGQIDLTWTASPNADELDAIIRITTLDADEERLVSLVQNTAGLAVPVAEKLVQEIMPNSWARQGGPGAVLPTRDGLQISQTLTVQRKLAKVLAAIQTAMPLDRVTERSTPVDIVRREPQTLIVDEFLATLQQMDETQAVKLEEALQRHQKQLSRNKDNARSSSRARLIVGRVTDGATPLSDEFCDNLGILPGGFFVSLAYGNMPLRLRFPGFMPVDVFVSKSEVESLVIDDIQLKRVSVAEQGTLRGQITWPEGESFPLGLKLTCLPEPGIRSWHTIDVPVHADGRFSLAGLTPMRYSLKLTAPKFRLIQKEFILLAGSTQSIELPTIRADQLTIEFVKSDALPIGESESQKADIYADGLFPPAPLANVESGIVHQFQMIGTDVDALVAYKVGKSKSLDVGRSLASVEGLKQARQSDLMKGTVLLCRSIRDGHWILIRIAKVSHGGD